MATYIQFTGRLKSTSLDGVIAEAQQVAISSTDNTNIKTYIDNKISTVQTNLDTLAGTVYRTKGSITFEGLKALTSGKVGDVWNVNEAFTLSGRNYAAYTNVVCVKDFSAAITPSDTYWDALGGVTVNTSHFAEIYTYAESVLPKKENSGSESESQDVVNRWVEIASHLKNRDLVLIEGTTGSGGTPCELINRYTIKYSENSIMMNFEFFSKGYMISLQKNGDVFNVSKVTIGNSLSARLAAVEKQLQLV